MNRYSSIVSFALLFYMAQLNAEPVADISSKQESVRITSAPVNISDSAPGLTQQAINADSGLWLLHAEEWELNRTGESILSLPALKSLIKTWLQDQSKKIEIQYPGGEEGEFWVHELADWMVSLAIPSDHMIFIAGSGSADIIKFQLVK